MELSIRYNECNKLRSINCFEKIVLKVSGYWREWTFHCFKRMQYDLSLQLKNGLLVNNARRGNVNTLNNCCLVDKQIRWLDFLTLCETGLSAVSLIKLIMSKTKFTINSNGSVKVEGDFEIVDTNGSVYGLQGRTIVSLCRCGRSSNKPFCDGSHKEHFEHDAKAFDLPPKKV